MSVYTDCAHVECACPAAPGMRYCGTYCREKDESQKEEEKRNPGQLLAAGNVCDCGHPECEHRISTGEAMHEQAR